MNDGQEEEKLRFEVFLAELEEKSPKLLLQHLQQLYRAREKWIAWWIGSKAGFLAGIWAEIWRKEQISKEIEDKNEE